MEYRPRIGLTMRLELETRRFYLGRDYSEAVEASGGVPVHIPLIADPEFVGRVIDGLDGVLLPGSDSDVDPGYYGEQPHPNLKRVVPEKDQTEMLVLEEAEKRELPVLAICYGMQALNVSRGGSLIQDISAQVEDNLKHEQGLPLDRNSHGIAIAKKGILAGLASSGEVKVNSHHHQAIRSVGSDLTATAWANDGVVECIEDARSDRFVLGVQWHPELSWRKDGLSAAIFKQFVAACASWKEKRKTSLRAGG
ncbi:MAG: gamma-glutamyl-gamma-aminobutyrate hydrolase family protein [Acidobacteria bacterium]|nr:gamma-glutamyl-gamma-aminobutyrate hydrolase family protein [Acidobacteriota bacterium]